jgi:hypothetical protein
MLSRGSTSAGAVGSSKAEWAVKARPAILGRIVAFDQDRFVGPHLGHVEPTVSGVVPDAVGLAYPVAVDQIRGDEIRESDANKSDKASMSRSDLIIHRAPTLPVLVLITYLPGFAPPWTGRSHATTMVLNRFGRRQVTFHD